MRSVSCLKDYYRTIIKKEFQPKRHKIRNQTKNARENLIGQNDRKRLNVELA